MSGASPRTVLVTGGTGAWGTATLRELRAHGDRFRVIALARPGRHSDRTLREFAGWPELEVVYGDLTDPVVVAACVARANVVLHLGALVSPLADEQPEQTFATNVGGIRNIVAAVKAQPDPSRIAVVGIGSIAEEGSRTPPQHWGRIGDPVRVSAFDVYGQSKVVAERELAESGLPTWTWLRQTGILHPGMIQIRDPIMSHPPLGGVMEWVSAEDSARLAVGLCDPDVPEEVWGGTWHIGGGEAWRLTNWQFLEATAGALGIGDIQRWYDRDWFALKNFHGFWFTDSDRLHELVPFRADTVEAAFARAGAAISPLVRAVSGYAAPIAKRFVLRPLIERRRGTLGAIRRNDEAEIAAMYGSLAAWQAIGDWSGFVPSEPSRTPAYLDHGYDEDRAPSAWTVDDYTGAAAFRGGLLLSEDAGRGEVARPLDWACADGHRFTASPRLVLAAGHWCPDCVRDPAGYERQAERNAFLAQVID